MPDLVRQLMDLVLEQQREVEKAVVECGKYSLFKRSLEIARAIGKSGVLNVSNSQVLPSTSKQPPECSTSLCASLCASTFLHTSPSCSQFSPLAQKLAPLPTKLGLPLQAIERIAEKANELIATSEYIVSAPSLSSEAAMVKSHSGRRLHL